MSECRCKLSHNRRTRNDFRLTQFPKSGKSSGSLKLITLLWNKTYSIIDNGLKQIESQTQQQLYCQRAMSDFLTANCTLSGLFKGGFRYR
jgi:hypothetical protein